MSPAKGIAWMMGTDGNTLESRQCPFAFIPFWAMYYMRPDTVGAVASGGLSKQGVWKGQDWMYATRPLCMLMEKDSALPTASTQTQERPWPDVTKLAETGKVALLNGCGGVTCNRDTSSTLARFQEAES